MQGHDVAAIACPERFVVGLDVSENAIKQATKVRVNTFGYFDLVLQSLLIATVSKIYVTKLQYYATSLIILHYLLFF